MGTYETTKRSDLTFLTLQLPEVINMKTDIGKGKLNPLTPMSDQDRISPNNINTISSKQVMRIKKNIN